MSRLKAKNMGSKNKGSASRRTRRPKQLSFLEELPKQPRVFGGAMLKGNPKTSRTLSSKESLHLVLKSAQAFGPHSMLQRYNVDKIDSLIRGQAKLCHLKIYHLVNVGNHLHLVIKLQDAKLFAKFIRAVTGLIARHVLHKERGRARETLGTYPSANEKKKTRFWVARPFTRLIAWGRDYNHVSSYMQKNRNQGKDAFVAWGFDTIDLLLIRSLDTG